MVSLLKQQQLYRFYLLVLLLIRVSFIDAKGAGGSGGGGGGGGRGSGSSSSSGGGYYAASAGGHGYRDNSGGGSGCDSSCQTILLSIFLSISGLLFCCCGAYAFKTCKTRQDFVSACKQAEKEVGASAKVPSNTSNRPVIEFQTAEYTASYTDSTHENGTVQMQCQGKLTLKEVANTNTTPTGNSINANTTNLRSITGEGADQDGLFQIPEGKVSIWTGKAYWIEKASGSMIQTLVTGTFARNTVGGLKFTGGFVCNNGANGNFTHFELQPTSEMNDVNLVSNAVASAMPHAPRYSHPPQHPPQPQHQYSALTPSRVVLEHQQQQQQQQDVECAMDHHQPPSYPAPPAPTTTMDHHLTHPCEDPAIPSIFRPPPEADYEKQDSGNRTLFKLSNHSRTSAPSRSARNLMAQSNHDNNTTTNVPSIFRPSD